MSQVPESLVSKNSLKKKKLTLYWGVEINYKYEDLKNLNEDFYTKTECLQLIPLKKMHSTLLFVGKKENPNEEVFKPYEGKECKLIIDAFGYSDNALALRVKSIKIDDNDVPTFATQQHITVALKTGIQAKDSVLTLTGQGTIVDCCEYTIIGTIKRFMY